MKAAFLVGGFFYGNTQKHKNCQKGKKCLACFIQIGKSLPQTPHKHGGDEVDKELLKSRAEAGIVAMENMLADGSHDDAVFIVGRIRHILGLLSDCDTICPDAHSSILNAGDSLSDAKFEIEADGVIPSVGKPITEASFPAIGPFNTAALSKVLAGLSVRAGNEP